MKNVTIFHSCHSDYVCFYAKVWIYCTLKVGQICSFVENHYGKMTEYSGKVSFQKKECVLILVLLLYKWNTYYRWKFTIHLMLCKTFYKVSKFLRSFFISRITQSEQQRESTEKKRRTRSNRCEFCSCWQFLWETSFVFFWAILMIENPQTIFMHFFLFLCIFHLFGLQFYHIDCIFFHFLQCMQLDFFFDFFC